MSIDRIGGGPYKFCQAVNHGDTVYLAGQVAADRAGEDLLQQAGSDRSKMLSVTVLLADIGDFGVLNEEWDAWVDDATLPARATFQAPLALPDILVELVVTAAL